MTKRFFIIAALLCAIATNSVMACGARAAAKLGLKSVVTIYALQNGQKISSGSGIILNTEGLILTNQHVIEDGDAWITMLPDGRMAEVSIIKSDEHVDLAVVKINANNIEGALPPVLTPITFATEQPEIGDYLVSIGNPFNTGMAVTGGIMSANTTVGDLTLIQHDGAVNHGNSGGALLNEHGELVGVNEAIYAPNDTFIGIAWAIPMNTVHKFLEK